MAYLTANGGTDADHGFIVEAGTAQVLAPEQKHLTVETIGRAGAWLAKTTTGASQLSVPAYFEGTSGLDADDLRVGAAVWLTSAVPYRISLADVEGYWLGKLSGVTPLSRINATARECVLVFDLFSPYLYGADVTVAIADGVNVIPYAGTAPADPVITLVPDADVGFVAVTCVETGESVTVGQPETYDDPANKGMTPLLSVSGADVPAASNMTYVDGGTVAGTLVSNGYSLSPGWPGGSYSAGADKHGPGKVWPLAAVATDFRAEAVLAWIDNASRGMGRVELYLYDSAADFSAAHILGKVALKDTTISAIATYFEARAGTLATGHTIASTHSAYWNSGKIRLGIGRENGRWTCDIGVWVAGRWQARFDAAFTELSTFPTYGKTVAAVGLHIGQYVAYPVVAQQACYSIAVSGIGMAGAAALIPANSEVVLDMRNGMATIDGTDARALLDPHSRPFAVPVGGCSLLVETTGGGADSVELVTQKTGATEVAITSTRLQTVTLVADRKIGGLLFKGHGHAADDAITVWIQNMAGVVFGGGAFAYLPLNVSAEFLVPIPRLLVPTTGTYKIAAALYQGTPVLLKSTTNPYAGGALDTGANDDLYFAVLGAPAAITGTVAFTERDL